MNLVRDTYLCRPGYYVVNLVFSVWVLWVGPAGFQPIDLETHRVTTKEFDEQFLSRSSRSTISSMWIGSILAGVLHRAYGFRRHVHDLHSTHILQRSATVSRSVPLTPALRETAASLRDMLP